MKEALQPANVIVPPRPKIPEPIALSHPLITVSDRASFFPLLRLCNSQPTDATATFDHSPVEREALEAHIEALESPNSSHRRHQSTD